MERINNAIREITLENICMPYLLCTKLSTQVIAYFGFLQPNTPNSGMWHNWYHGKKNILV